VISPESVDSETCQREVAHAARNKKRLIPVLHRSVPEQKVPAALVPINWIFFRDTDDFESTFALLIDALETDLDWKRRHTRLLQRSLEWNSKNRNDSFLLRGVDLQVQVGPCSGASRRAAPSLRSSRLVRIDFPPILNMYVCCTPKRVSVLQSLHAVSKRGSYSVLLYQERSRFWSRLKFWRPTG
jgi:hypothetical protein